MVPAPRRALGFWRGAVPRRATVGQEVDVAHALRLPDPADMIEVPGGTFRMGSDRHYPDEAPAHRVTVDRFWIDRTPVTNRAFRKFVNDTGYITFAEIR